MAPLSIVGILATIDLGVVPFAVRGAITEARYRMDGTRFVLIGTILRMEGGTVRDLLIRFVGGRRASGFAWAEKVPKTKFALASDRASLGGAVLLASLHGIVRVEQPTVCLFFYMSKGFRGVQLWKACLTPVRP